MRLTLAVVIFIVGLLISFANPVADYSGLLNPLGMVLMITGAVQIAYIVGGNLFPHTPPQLEFLYRNEKIVLWVAAPVIALMALLIWVVWMLLTRVV